MKRSAALTLAARHKQRKAIWAFEKYGKELRIAYKTPNKGITKTVEILSPKVAKAQWKVKGEYSNLDQMLVIPTGVPIPDTLHAVCSAKELNCAVTNCPNRAQAWHHIKHRKKIKGDFRQRTITAYAAKQIPVCKKHHEEIHKGKYDGPSLRKLKGFVPDDFE